MKGESVAGVRYRARQSVGRCYTRLFPVHAPLVFDIIDRWKERSIGRCTYHVAVRRAGFYTPPGECGGGRASADGSGLRIRSAPGPIAGSRRNEPNPIFPMTLDLRMPAPGQKIATRERPGLVP